MYFVTQGEIDIRLTTTAHHYKRLAKFGRGSMPSSHSGSPPRPTRQNASPARQTWMG